MSTALEQRLRSFALALLERHGAMVDWPENGTGMALLPPELARTLRVDEELTLTDSAAQAGGDGGGGRGSDQAILAVNLATDFLERVEPLVAPHATAVGMRLDNLYLKKSAMDEPVARFFGFPNARVRVATARAVRLVYHCWHFQAAVDSEDRWEELVSVQVNSASGARIELPDPLHMTDARESSAAIDEATPDLLRARKKAALLAGALASPFLARLEARLERDRRRISEYYAALAEEASPVRSREPVDPVKVEERRRAVDVERRRRLLELEDRYALRLHLDPVAMVALSMPALEVELEVSRRPEKGAVRVYWNPLLKSLEPLACAECGANIVVVRFDESLCCLCTTCAAEV